MGTTENIIYIKNIKCIEISVSGLLLVTISPKKCVKMGFDTILKAGNKSKNRQETT